MPFEYEVKMREHFANMELNFPMVFTMLINFLGFQDIFCIANLRMNVFNENKTTKPNQT